MGRRFDLGPVPYRSPHFVGDVMLISDDVRGCVCFLGMRSGDSFNCFGTGFIVGWKQIAYVITAQHVVAKMGRRAFAIRINNRKGGVAILDHDGAMGKVSKWFIPDDPTVDLAACVMADVNPISVPAITRSHILTDDAMKAFGVGIGDVCYTVGLFRKFAGDEKNLPVVHTGNIALLAGEQRVPVEKWRAGDAVVLVDSHLVEQISLDGLSGAPVFVRPSLRSSLLVDGKPTDTRVGTEDIKLLGVWQAAWDGLAGVSLDRRTEERVAIGMGTVVPAKYVIDLLESEAVADDRERRLSEGDRTTLPTMD